MDMLSHFSSDSSCWKAGYFVKPVKSKVFTGKVIRSINDLIGCGNSKEDLEILISDDLDILAEWGCFIYYDEIIDIRPYDSYGGRYDRWDYHYDSKVAEQILAAFKTWEDRPVSCSLDICVTGEGEILFLECNDAYSLGCYGLPKIPYAKLISARWSQLLKREDEFHF